jgi:uncharacterized protein (DUF2237 family)
MRSVWILALLTACEAKSAPVSEEEVSVMVDPVKTASSTPEGPRNVLGSPLAPCSVDPMTGWFRDGSCRTDELDRGLHVVCAEVDARFLEFTKGRGNDLSTPRPEHRFPGLKPQDRWCLCARRWLEAHEAGAAPKIILESTHEKALKIIPSDILLPYGRR